MKRTHTWLAGSLIGTLLVALLTLSPSASAQGAPGLTILSPAGALTPSPIVRTSFVVSFTLTNFQLVAPGAPGLVNAPEQGHIHVFLDGKYYSIVASEGPVAFDLLTAGQHTIKLQLVNNDHTPLIPDVSKTITVTASSIPVAAQVDLSGLVNGQSTLQNWAMANAAGTIIALILIAVVLMRKK